MRKLPLDSNSVVVLFPVALAFTLPVLTANVVLVGVAVTFDAILVTADTFLDVLAADIVGCVLVAAVASVAAVIVMNVAGDAASIVVAVELEMLVVVEGRRRPFFLAVALAAIARDLLVQCVLG